MAHENTDVNIGKKMSKILLKRQAEVKLNEETLFSKQKQGKLTDYQSEIVFVKGFSWTI